MYDLSYFNLGFRSESVSSFLKEFKENEALDDYLLDDAVNIIGDCLKIKEDNSIVDSFAGTGRKKGYENRTLLPLLSELYLNTSLTEIVNELKNIFQAINKIKGNRTNASDEEYEKVIKFFSDLSNLCLSNSAHQINSEKLAFI